jgi:hypothetical protein
MRARLAADPMDAEAQRALHEMITRDNVTANRELAMEHMPEAFTRCGVPLCAPLAHRTGQSHALCC